jgi:ferrous iron transport protein B
MELPARATAAISPPACRLVVALSGNPNTGKTTLFNALSGLNQRIGNYPGVTVETKTGHMICDGHNFDIVDLPGTYSLAPRSPDEMVAVDLILGRQHGQERPNVILSVVDASNLERNLYLTTQLMELGLPVVVALNMTDVAKAHGLRIDHQGLSRRLGVPVVPIQANKRRGLEELKREVSRQATEGKPPHGPAFPEAFDQEAAALQDEVGPETPAFLVRRLLLDVGGHTERLMLNEHGLGLHDKLLAARQRLAQANCGVPAIEARTRYAWIRQALLGCLERPAKRPITWTDRLDRVLTHKVWGTLIFLLVLFLVFQSIFTWAKPAMKLIGSGKDLLADGIRDVMPAGPFTSLLTDGIVEGVGSVLVFLPQIVILFGFIAILEDCGYMARAAFLMDKLMSRCGLSGKSFIPLLSSVACAVPGIMATRVIEQRRDRLATILVAPLMSCSARLPVYTLLIGTFLTRGHAWWVPGFTLFCLYLLGFVMAPLVTLVLKRTLLRGETPVFVMEMPLYKLPSLRTVMRRMIDSAWAFLRRAGTLILASMVLVWALLYFPSHNAEGDDYDAMIAAAVRSVEEDTKQLARLEQDDPEQERQAELKEKIESTEERIREQQQEWKANSLLGRLGRGMEPVFAPLGWDWRIGTAALASFPAREVVVGTLGIIYKVGKVESDDILESEDAGNTDLGRALRDDPVYSVPVALSLMVFFALCCQCASTLAVIRRETNSWRWPIFTFVYMTVLAYVGAMVVYQVGRLF